MGKDQGQAMAEFGEVRNTIFAGRKCEGTFTPPAVVSSLHLSRR